MKTSTVQNPRTGSVTIKLDDADRKRIAALATAKKRTPHYLMKEAILEYVKKRGKTLSPPPSLRLSITRKPGSTSPLTSSALGSIKSSKTPARPSPHATAKAVGPGPV